MKNYTLYVNCFLQISIKPLILLWSESGVSPGFTSISSEKFVGPAASGPEGRVVFIQIMLRATARVTPGLSPLPAGTARHSARRRTQIRRVCALSSLNKHSE